MVALIFIFCMWFWLQMLILLAQGLMNITPKEMRSATNEYNIFVRWIVFTYPALYTVNYKKLLAKLL